MDYHSSWYQRRRILTEEGLGTSYLARKAAKELIQKTGVDPDTIDALIVTTTTPDYKFPSTASIVLGKLGLKMHLRLISRLLVVVSCIHLMLLQA